SCDLGVFFYFKYFYFFLSTMNGVFGTSFVLRGILLPLGISFFTFQQISFIVDTYRGEIRDCRFLEYALFVAFFPQLIAGPIVNHSEMLPQFERLGQEEVNWERIAEGFVLFVLGLFKKVLLADTFGRGVDYGYENLTALGRADAVLVIVFYALQLYFDFSGYCDMARGLGKMLGIEIPVNFDSPYKAVNIVDFWKRWHITLNRFFTKYVYIPLGGNRKGPGRIYVNLLIVFFLSGLWHGAGWNFIVWGMLHGVLYVATRFWQKNIRKYDNNVRKTIFTTIMSQILLFIYVSVAWVYFRAADIAQANSLLKAACLGKRQKISQALAECFQLDEFWYIIKVLHLDNYSYSRYILMVLILAVGLYLAMAGKNAAQLAERFRYRAWSALVIAVLAVWCVLSFSGVSTFLYFNF
ncbi:MAG: MBOAT family protein, partial [Lachnospiraceae bacterium]|nr:MBOAT family protein [Lachnospiraceae bacterium]